MASFLSSDDINGLTSDLSSHFDTFSNNIITVWKEPIKNYASISSVGYPGYVDNTSNITLTPVSGQFPALVRYARDYKAEPFPDINTMLEDGQAMIKVKQDCRDFIKNGKTEYININDQSFNLQSFEYVQNFLGLKFYYFKLSATL